MTDLRLRPAVRGLMIDPSNRVLLVRLRFGDGFDGWTLPGGGVEDREDHRAAPRRELIEETGVPEVFVGPPLWHRTTLFPDVDRGRWDGQHNTTSLVPCHTFDPAPAMGADELAAEGVLELGRWTVAELSATAIDVIKPNGLSGLVRTCSRIRCAARTLGPRHDRERPTLGPLSWSEAERVP